MSVEIDNNGYPVVYSDDQVNLGVKIVPTKSGNPAHDSFTGRFSFLPSGVQVLRGEELFKELSTGTRKHFFERVQISGANQVSARIINGKLHIVLLKDGRRLDSFSVKPRSDRADAGTPERPGEAAGARQASSLVVRDAVVDAAREGLQGKELKKMLTERGIDFSGGLLAEIEQMIKQQRQTDVIDYLHQTLRKQVHKEHQIDRVRLSVGRGFLRQVFSRYSEDEIRTILVRLQGRGWSEDVIHANVISKLPKRLREPIQSSVRRTKGKEEIREEKREEDKEATKSG